MNGRSTRDIGDGVLQAVLVVVVAGALGAASPAPQAGYLAENAQAMDRMMGAMHTPSTGDVDRDFVAMMAPHHQGAIDMARTELKYGRNETLRRLAQEIIVAQGQEIEVMHLAIASPRSSAAAPRVER